MVAACFLQASPLHPVRSARSRTAETTMESTEIDVRTTQVAGLTLGSLSRAQLVGRLLGMAKSGRGGYVCFCEAHLCVQARRDPAVRRALTGAALVLPDGVSMTLGASLTSGHRLERHPGPDVMLDVCREGVSHAIRHFFYGGALGVAESLATAVRQRFPGLVVAGTYTPPFRPLTDSEESEVKRQVEGSGTEMLWVGLGAPKQELWMSEHSERIRGPLMLGVGAAFDFHSGSRRRAPRFVRAVGMEWFYRMLTGGRRVFWRNLRYETAFTRLILAQACRTAWHGWTGHAATGEAGHPRP